MFVRFFRTLVINEQRYLPKADKSYQNANGVLKNAVPDGHTLHSPHAPVCVQVRLAAHLQLNSKIYLCYHSVLSQA